MPTGLLSVFSVAPKLQQGVMILRASGPTPQ